MIKQGILIKWCPIIIMQEMARALNNIITKPVGEATGGCY